MAKPQTKPASSPPATPAPATMPQQSATKKSKVWIWVLGGCLGIALISLIAIIALGWWGARKVKKEIQKYSPEMEQLKNNVDKWNQESEEWQKKSEEYREGLPSPEELESQLPADPNNMQQ